MEWINCSPEETKKCLQSPFYFMVANVMDEKNETLLPSSEYLSGTTISSLYRLRNLDNRDGGFFVFGDLMVRKPGNYRLHCSLFEIVEGQVQNKKTIVSDRFQVFTAKQYPGPLEATFLSRAFSNQGVKLRIRKGQSPEMSTAMKRKSEVQDSTKHNKKKEESFVPSYASSPDAHFARWQSAIAPKKSISPPSPPLALRPILPPGSPTTSEDWPITPPPLSASHDHRTERLPPIRMLFATLPPFL